MDEELIKLIISIYERNIQLIRNGYERTITALEQGYKAELKVKDELIEALRKQLEYSEQLVEAYRQGSDDLMEMARIMAPSKGPPGSRVDVRVTGVDKSKIDSSNIQAGRDYSETNVSGQASYTGRDTKLDTGDTTMTGDRTINAKEYHEDNRDMRGNTGNVVEKIEGNYIQHGSEQKMDLAEAAAEIQKLLKQLEENNPTATEAQQQVYVDAAVPPPLKARFVSALPD